jgi:hypothetical protein
MSWMTREGKCAEKLVQVASMHGIREGASTGDADGSSAHSADVAVVGSTDVGSGVGSTDTGSGSRRWQTRAWLAWFHEAGNGDGDGNS